MKLRALVTALCLSGQFLFSQGSEIGNAREFPARPVELVLSGSAGGGTDIAVRLLGTELSKTLGVPVIMTNKGGAGGALSAEYVARAKPDGYTVLAASGSVFTVILITNPTLPYKLSDFIPLAKYASSPHLFVVGKASPFKRFEDIISYARKNPGKLTCATAGTGTASHFNLVLVNIQDGVDIAHMPVKSGGELVTALLGGQVDFIVHSLSPVMGLMQSGDARGLAANAAGRIPGFPNIPTLKELGYPPSSRFWVGFYLPKGTPKPAAAKLAAAFKKAMHSPAVIKNLEDTGNMLDYQDGPTLAKFVPEEYKAIEEISRKAKSIK